MSFRLFRKYKILKGTKFEFFVRIFFYQKKSITLLFLLKRIARIRKVHYNRTENVMTIKIKTLNAVILSLCPRKR